MPIPSPAFDHITHKKNTIMTKLTNTLFAGAALLCSALSASALTSPLTADTTITSDETVSGEKFAINNGVILTVGDGVSNTTLTIENTGDGPLANNGKIIVSKGSTFNVIRNDFVEWTSASVAGNIDIYGTLVTKYGEKSGSGMYNGYNLAVNADKTINVYGTLTYENGAMSLSVANTTGGRVNLHSGSTTTVNKVVFNGGGTSGAVLKIDGNAVFQRKASGGNVYITVGSNSKGSKIDLSTADAVNFATMTLQKGSAFGFILGDNVVSLEKLNADATAESLTFEDFKNDIFQIKDYSNLSIVDGATLRVANSSSYTDIALIKDTALEAGQYWTITSEGFLNVVPEPAEYAAILGAIAIAFGMLQHARRGGGCRPQ